MAASSEPSPAIPLAPELPLPNSEFYSVEYPGYVQSSSISLAIETLGGQKTIDMAFKSKRKEAIMECTLRPGNPFSHPIHGETVPSNKILLKIVKRKLKTPSADDKYTGEFTAEAIGTVPKTARFRSMLDFQYQPDRADPITELRTAMDNLDSEAIHNYEIPKETAEYRIPGSSKPTPRTPADDFDMNLDPSLREQPDMISNLRMFPPPVFSRSVIFQQYGLRSNPASIVHTTIDEKTGEEKKRLINRMRFKGLAPAAIHYSEPDIPSGPLPQVEAERNRVNQTLLGRLKEHFEERPIWTRSAVLSQFEALEVREIMNSKAMLPLIAYVFHDGPWRDTLVRFGYDPRKFPDARFYQRIYFRNVNHILTKPSAGTRRQERQSAKGKLRPWDEDPEKDTERKKAHLFDGKALYKDTAAFQLCDITDPLLREMILQTKDLREVPDERDGWYPEEQYDQIRGVLRLKYFHLLEGRTISDEECREMMLESVEADRTLVSLAREKGTGKRSKPKARGQANPEDAAAIRLRAAMNNAQD